MTESNEPFFRFSLKTLCIWLVFIAVVGAGVVTGYVFWQMVMTVITLTMDCGAATLGMTFGNSQRVFFVGFVVFFVAHSFASQDKLKWLNIRSEDLPTCLWIEAITITRYELDMMSRPNMHALRNRYKVTRNIGHQAASIIVAAIAAYLMRAIYVYSNRNRTNE